MISVGFIIFILYGTCGAQQHMGQTHLFTGSPKAQAEEGGSPSSITQSTNGPGEAAKDGAVLGRPQSPTKKRGKSGIGTNLKENLKYLGKAALTTFPIQSFAPNRAVVFSFINHSQRLGSWTDGTSISLGKVDPTHG